MLKRGTRIEYTYASGKVVNGRVLGPYAADMPGWYRCELTDEVGTNRGGCHVAQLREIVGTVKPRSGRPERLALYRADGKLSNTFGLDDTIATLQPIFAAQGLVLRDDGTVVRA